MSVSVGPSVLDLGSLLPCDARSGTEMTAAPGLDSIVPPFFTVSHVSRVIALCALLTHAVGAAEGKASGSGAFFSRHCLQHALFFTTPPS
jgi:hypothetical protein